MRRKTVGLSRLIFDRICLREEPPRKGTAICRGCSKVSLSSAVYKGATTFFSGPLQSGWELTLFRYN